MEQIEAKSFFGASLQQLTLKENRADSDIPSWIEFACKALTYKDTIVDNLWLKGGSIDEMNRLVSGISRNSIEVSFKPFSALTVARVLYLFFKKLPQPLLTYELHDTFLGASYTEIFEDQADQLSLIRALIGSLPRANRAALAVLLEVFAKVFDDKNRETQVSTLDLWGPVLLCRASVHDIQREIPDACRLLRLMIENYNSLFGLSAGVSGLLPARSRSAPIISPRTWLRRTNDVTVSTMKSYLEKIQSVEKDFDGWCKEANEALPEFRASIGLVKEKLIAIIETVSQSPDSILQIIDTYHLERFYSYVLDFHSSMIKNVTAGAFNRHFTNRRLRGGLERLSLSMQYEMFVFFSALDSVFSGKLRQTSKFITSFRVHTLDFFKDQAAQNVWSTQYGADTFMVEFDRFITDYNAVGGSGTIAADVHSHLRNVLDDSNTGFVTVFKFAEFLKPFGPLSQSIRKVNQPWFHGYLSKLESEKLLEPFQEGTFLVRFAEPNPGAFAVSYVDSDRMVKSINVDTLSNNSFSVSEGDSTSTSWWTSWLTYNAADEYGACAAQRSFPTIPELIAHYDKLLRTPLRDKVSSQSFFFGDFTLEETNESLDGEAVGTFLIRFSRQANNFTCSHVKDGESDIAHIRLERYPTGEIGFESYIYEDMDHFVEANTKWFKTPYRSDNVVSSTQEEDALRRSSNLKSLIEDEEGADEDAPPGEITRSQSSMGMNAGKSTATAFGRRGSSVLLLNAHQHPGSLSTSTGSGKLRKEEDHEEQLAILLHKAAVSDEMELDEETKFLDLLFRVSPEQCDKIQKKVHTKLAEKRPGVGLNVGLFKKSLKFSTYSPFVKGAIINTAYAIEIEITNKWKEVARFNVVRPSSITSQCFLSVSPQEGDIEPGKSTKLQITVVLYKPIVLKEILGIRFQVGEDWRQSHALPLRVICSRECLIGATKYDDHWIIPNIERVKRLGGGAAASVWLADLFGAKVAMKEWELGAKDPPPPDFWVELSVLKSLRHENLVSFVGAIGKTGTALIVLEFLNGGSMDKFLNIMAPPDPLDPTPPSTEASDPNIPRNIQFKDRLQMAIDGAKGILFLHDHNKIHRDIKSLNFLVDGDTMATKVSDFGEAASKDSGLKEATGSQPWMAAEVIRSEVYSMKADVFSFGLVLYELLTNSYPVRNMEMVMAGRIPPIPEELAKEHNDLVSLIKACCRSNPDKRPSFYRVVRELEVLKAKLMIRRPRKAGGNSGRNIVRH